MEVKFRMGQREEKIAGGEFDAPHNGIPNPSHIVTKTISTVQVNSRDKRKLLSTKNAFQVGHT
jgi:hypothetical protein